MLYLFLLLNLACGLAILRFGLRHYSLVLAAAVFFFILETCFIAAEIGWIDSFQWPLIVGSVVCVLTFLFAKPFTYIMGWWFTVIAALVPFAILGLEPGTGFANTLVLLAMVFAVVIVFKFRSHFRTLVIGCYGGYITGSFFSLIALLFMSTEATQFTLDNPNSLIPIMLGPTIGAIASTVILFMRPAFTEGLILYPLESNSTGSPSIPGNQPAG